MTPKETLQSLLDKLEATPQIYHDLRGNVNYYPWSALVGGSNNPCNIIESPPPIYWMFNGQSKRHYDPITGEQYIRAERLTDVGGMKWNLQVRDLIAKKPGIVYFKPARGDEVERYYFPVGLSCGEGQRAERVEVKGDVPLSFYEEDGVWYDPKTGKPNSIVKI